MNEIRLDCLSLNESPLLYPACKYLAICFYIDNKTLNWYQDAIQFIANQPEVLCVTASCYQNEDGHLLGLIVTRNELNKNQQNQLFRFCDTTIFYYCIQCPLHFKDKYERINNKSNFLIFNNGVMPTFENLKQCLCLYCKNI